MLDVVSVKSFFIKSRGDSYQSTSSDVPIEIRSFKSFSPWGTSKDVP